MADIIDLALASESRKYLQKLLDARGINYFLKQDASRPFQLEPKKVELVVRTAARAREQRVGRPQPTRAFEQARALVRRELIRRVVAEMLQTGF